MSEEEEVWSSGADMKDYFYPIGLPEAIRGYFGIRPVRLDLLTHPSAKSFIDAGRTHLPARKKICPMGFTWSLWISQVIRERIFAS